MLDVDIGKRYQGGYQDDPNIVAVDVDAPVTFVMDPSRLQEGSYRRRYYQEPDISQELVVRGYVGATLYSAFIVLTTVGLSSRLRLRRSQRYRASFLGWYIAIINFDA